jgi:hypothetical protein
MTPSLGVHTILCVCVCVCVCVFLSTLKAHMHGPQMWVKCYAVDLQSGLDYCGTSAMWTALDYLHLLW